MAKSTTYYDYPTMASKRKWSSPDAGEKRISSRCDGVGWYLKMNGDAGPCIQPHHFWDGSEIVEKRPTPGGRSPRPRKDGGAGQHSPKGQLRWSIVSFGCHCKTPLLACCRPFSRAHRCWLVRHILPGCPSFSLVRIFSPPSSPRGENSARGSPSLLSTEFDRRTNHPQPPSSAITALFVPTCLTKSIGWAASFPGRQ